MTYEIEKRSLFLQKKEFESAEKKVSLIGKKKEYYKYKTFLFKNPSYLRIRLIQGKPDAEITIKTSTHTDSARKEINEFVPLIQLPIYISQIKKKGFTECVSILAESQKYIFDGIEIAFNNIEHLGLIVEFEAVTENKKNIDEMEIKLKSIMDSLQFIELPSEEYKKMMDKMYGTSMKSVDQQNFNLD